MKAEFFLTSDGRDVVVQERNDFYILQADDPIVNHVNDIIEQKFPLAYDQLAEQYDRKFERIRRFLKCNFGAKDNELDLDNGQFNFEFVSCPMRGECPDENIICNPALEIGISVREKEVLKLIADGHTSNDIADLLFISFRTVETHRKNIQRKLNLHSIAEMSSFAHKNHIV